LVETDSLIINSFTISLNAFAGRGMFMITKWCSQKQAWFRCYGTPI